MVGSRHAGMLWLPRWARQVLVLMLLVSGGRERQYSRKQISDVILESGKCHEGKEISQQFVFRRWTRELPLTIFKLYHTCLLWFYQDVLLEQSMYTPCNSNCIAAFRMVVMWQTAQLYRTSTNTLLRLWAPSVTWKSLSGDSQHRLEICFQDPWEKYRGESLLLSNELVISQGSDTKWS